MTKIAIVPNAAGTGTFTIEAPNSNSNRTLVLPDAAGELFTNAGGTLTGALTGTDITLSGGVYLGGTAAANLLDDYEEGSWTPSTAGLTGVSVQNASYTKIGSLVLVDIRIIWTGSDGLADFLLFGNLPFVSAATIQPAHTGAVFYQGTQIFSSVVSHIPIGVTHMQFYSGAGGGFVGATRNQVNGAYDFLVTSTYRTDA